LSAAAEPLAPAPASPPRTKAFRRKFDTPKLLPEALKRQGCITTHAFLALGREAALAFLNHHDAECGGRPLEIATASDEGLVRVERAVEALSQSRR
jgi:hypothetical protein